MAPRCWATTASRSRRALILATWDPHTRPIVTEYAGTVKFEHVEEGATVAKQIDDVTGLSTLVVIDPKRGSKSPVQGTAPAGQAASTRLARKSRSTAPIIRWPLPSRSARSSPSRTVRLAAVGDVLARIPQESAKTRDITGGLPRVAELFEARSPKDAGVLAEVTGTVSFGKDTKGKQRLVITEPDGTAHEYLIPKDKHVMAHDGQVVNKGEIIVDGPADPHDILRLKGIEELARYIIDEVQDVYRLQGVKINDKHIEVIVRQMLRRVVITDPGDSKFIREEQVERSEVLDENDRLIERRQAAGRISKTYCSASPRPACSTDSFISAASFQETTRVLTEAAIMGKRDELRGLKENVIVGRLIPAGTGLAYHRTRRMQSAGEDAAQGHVRSARRTGSYAKGCRPVDGAMRSINIIRPLCIPVRGRKSLYFGNLICQRLTNWCAKVAKHRSQQEQGARPGRQSCQAWRVHPRLHHDAEEAELRACVRSPRFA